jgi:hypothetical protein
VLAVGAVRYFRATLERVERVVGVMVGKIPHRQPQLLETPILEAVVAEHIQVPHQVPEAQVLSSLKYLTTLAHHSLVALLSHCPHPVGSTSTL